MPGDGRQRYWKTAARGFSFELTEGDESQTAMRMLTAQLEEAARKQADRWWAETEPVLDHTWRRLAGLSNTGVRLTAAELEKLQRDINELLGEYVRRAEADTPADARRVRILRHYLPEAQ